MLAGDGVTQRLDCGEGWDPVQESLAIAAIQERLFGERPAATTVSRYELREPIAQGAMGVVYRAFDPLLGREVAVKLIRAGRGDDREAHARLLREAQSIAGISHPNVIEVFDTGTFELGHAEGSGVFMVLALVDGPTLYRWLAQRHRGWREVLPLLLAAGRGLAAVHRAGLVHRDFKPANVLVGDRVRVADFGLAASVDSEGERVVAGTPGYMAPEQRRGHFDARSDQYAFGTTLWHALYGRLPSAVKSDVPSAAEGVDTRPPPNSSVPHWLHAVVARAMHPDPDQRFEDMDALLTALERDPVRRALRWASAVGLVGLAAAVGFAVGRPEDPRCTGEPIAAAWDANARQVIAQRFEGSGVRFAEHALAELEGGVERFASAWMAERDATCGREPGLTRDRTLDCLDRQRGHLVGMLEVFASAEASMISRTATTVDRLPRPAECAQLEPARVGDVVTSAELERAAALFSLGRNGDARALTTEALAAAEVPGLVAELEHLLCRIDGDEGATAAAVEQCERAWRWAERAGNPELVVRSLVMLTGVRRRLGALDRAWDDLELAEAKLARSPAFHRLRVEVDGVRATLMTYTDRERGIPRLEQQLVELERLHGPESTVTVSVLLTLGTVLHDLGEFDRARDVHERLLALLERRLGPMHPHTAAVLNNAGLLARSMGDYPEALAKLERSVAIKRVTPGWDTIRLSSTLQNLADLYGVLGDFTRAQASARAALALLDGRSVGSSEAEPFARSVLARALRLAGERAAAHAEARAAMASVQAHRRDRHRDDALETVTLELARTSIDNGDVDAARGMLLEVLERRRVHGEDHPEMVEVWEGLALADAVRGDLASAYDAFERAQGLQRRLGFDPAWWAGECERLAEAVEGSDPQWADRLRERARAERRACVLPRLGPAPRAEAAAR